MLNISVRHLNENKTTKFTDAEHFCQTSEWEQDHQCTNLKKPPPFGRDLISELPNTLSNYQIAKLTKTKSLVVGFQAWLSLHNTIIWWCLNQARPPQRHFWIAGPWVWTFYPETLDSWPRFLEIPTQNTKNLLHPCINSITLNTRVQSEINSSKFCVFWAEISVHAESNISRSKMQVQGPAIDSKMPTTTGTGLLVFQTYFPWGLSIHLME